MPTPEASFLALADRNRLLLFRLLLAGAFSVRELTEVTGLGQSLVSHHLAVLARHGWVAARREGRRRIYRSCVSGSPLAPVARWVERQVRLPGSWQPVPPASAPSGPAGGTRGGDIEDYLL